MAGAITGILEPSYGASAAVTKQRFVKLTGDQTVAQNDTTGGWCPGVAYESIVTSNANGTNEVTAGKKTAVQAAGIAWVEFSASITRGAEVSSTNDGRAKTAVSTEVVLGRCVKDAGGAGKLGLVALMPMGMGYAKP